MRYLSTRGDPQPRRFCEILLEGLAPDGGLYLPEHYPRVDAQTLTRWREVYQAQGYAALAHQILSLYIDDIPTEDLRAICQRTYTPAAFGSHAIVPVRVLERDLHITVRRSRSRTWPCSSWARRSSTRWSGPAAR